MRYGKFIQFLLKKQDRPRCTCKLRIFFFSLSSHPSQNCVLKFPRPLNFHIKTFYWSERFTHIDFCMQARWLTRRLWFLTHTHTVKPLACCQKKKLCAPPKFPFRHTATTKSSKLRAPPHVSSFSPLSLSLSLSRFHVGHGSQPTGLAADTSGRWVAVRSRDRLSPDV